MTRALKNEQKITSAWLTRMKKERIEKECQGLLEFLESPFTLDNLSGSEAVKAWLREDAELDEAGSAVCAAHGLPDCRAASGRARLSWCSAGPENWGSPASCSRISATNGWAPPNPTWRRSFRFCGRSARSWCSWTKPTRRPARGKAETPTAGCRGASTRCWPRRCPTRATADASSGFLPHRARTCWKWT